jgi:hypothetical protein
VFLRELSETEMVCGTALLTKSVNPAKFKIISKSVKKSDKTDAEALVKQRPVSRSPNKRRFIRLTHEPW